MEATPTLPKLTEQVKQYLENKFKLLKLECIDEAGTAVAGIVARLVVMISILVTFLFCSFTLAILIAHWLHSAWKGFGCITVLYILIAIAAQVSNTWLQNALTLKIIKKLIAKKQTNN